MMTGKIKFLALTVLLFVVALSTGGCGDALMIPECGYDSDCLDGEYCVAGQCSMECSHDDECPAGTHCEVYQRSGEVNPVQVCLDVNTMDNDGLSCESDEQCQAMLDAENARCGMHNRCVLISNSDDNGHNGANQQNNSNQENTNNNDALPTERVVIIVEQLDEKGEPLPAGNGDDGDDGDDGYNGDEGDNSDGGEGDLDDEGDEEEDPDYDNAGEDDINSDNGDNGDEEPLVRPVRLGAVVVRAHDGRAIGYGRLLAAEPAGVVDEQEPDLARPDPRLPLDESETCVDEPNDAVYTSLGGPGGRAYIELVDEDVLVLATDSLRWVQVIGDGPECRIGPQSTETDPLPDGEYRVLICVTDNDGTLPDDESCNVEYSGPFGGFADLEVTF